MRSGRGCGRRRRRGSRRGTETVHLSHCTRKRRILLSHCITIQSTRNTVAGCQKRQMSITLVNLTKKNTRTHKKEITYEHKTTKKERKDSEITQYEITQYDCDAGVSNTMSSYQDTITEYIML